MKNSLTIEEKVLTPQNGWKVLIASILVYIAAIVGIVLCGTAMDMGRLFPLSLIGFIVCLLYVCVGWIWWLGLKVIRPKHWFSPCSAATSAR